MIPWPWLIAAFALGGIASPIAIFAWFTGGFRSDYIYTWKATLEHAVNHKGEIEDRANELSGGLAFPRPILLLQERVGNDDKCAHCGAAMLWLNIGGYKMWACNRGCGTITQACGNCDKIMEWMPKGDVNGWLCTRGCGAFRAAVDLSLNQEATP